MKAIRAVAAVVLTLAASRASAQRADAVVLINSASQRVSDFQQRVQPYLDHFGVPYTVLDVATTNVGAAISDYALIVVGHGGLDPNHVYLDATEQSNLSAAVGNGCGLVSFDDDLTPNGSTPRYQYVQDIFGFGYHSALSGSGVIFTADAPGHYVSSRHLAGENLPAQAMTPAPITVPASVTVLARVQSSGDPLVAVTTHGLGRAVQWGSYAWMSHFVLGPLRGLDDVVWRSLAWAARKPFVMRGMPNFLTMRVDDVKGPLWWVNTSNAFQLKPWLGLFYKNVSDADASQLATLVNGGLATASVHSGTGTDFFYFNDSAGTDFSGTTVASHFQDAAAWHSTHGVPISKFVVPHFYEFGTNVFAELENWGVRFVGTQANPGEPYGLGWPKGGPYRLYEIRTNSNPNTGTYADYLTIPGHPELANIFFNCVTEIRDDAGYEWFPDNDVAGTVGRGTRQTKRAFDSMALSTLFTHEGYIQGISPANWQSILAGVMANVTSYNPIFVTMDYACQYLRAKHDSTITSSVFDPATQTLTTDLAGSADVATQFYVFTAGGGTILQGASSVPAFSGSARVTQQLGAPPTLSSIAVTPANPTVATGTTQQFVATAVYSDASTQNITGQAIWSSSNGAVATIGAGGLATAVADGTTSISAEQAGVSGGTTVTVQTAPLVITTTSLPVGAQNGAYVAPLSAAGGSPPYSWSLSSGTLPTGLGLSSGGVITGTPTTTGPFGFTVTVTDAAARSTFASLSITIVSSIGLSIWPSATPGNLDHGADSPVELGVKFRSDVSGTLTGLRFYKASTNTGTHVGNLWTSTGTLLATATFTGESASGWQQVSFPTPVAIAANTVYVASYHTNVGHYSQDLSYFASAGVDNPPLHALAEGASGGNGVYAYGSTSSFPNGSYNSSNYWVDVVFSAGTAPTLSSIAVTPANPTVATGASQQFTATGTYSDGSTQNVTGQVTWASSNGAVATIGSGGLATALAAGSTPISATQGAVSGGTTLTVQAPPLALSSVTLDPASVAGGGTSTGTVTLNGPAPTGGAVVGLSSSNTAAATVPADVTVAAGTTSATFTVSTSAVSASTSATLSASYGSSSATAVLAVTPPLAASAVALSPATVIGGSSSQGTVTLNGPATGTGAVVGLSSSDPTVVGVPASVTVPAGGTSATFAVATLPVTVATTATISATHGGATQTAVLTVSPAGASTLTLTPTSVVGGGLSTGTVGLTGPAPAGGAVVTLASSNATVATPTFLSVTIPAGGTSTTFTVSTSAVATTTTATISASYGGTSATALLTVTAPILSALALSPTSVVGGAPSTGTVSLGSPAPAAGIAVALTSSNTAAATVPASVTVPGGATSATFTVSTSPVTANASATLSASLGGTTRTATLTVTALSLSTLALSPTTAAEGDTSTGTVTLGGAAPVPVAVALTSSNTAAATVPASVTVPAGAASAPFTITTLAVSAATNVTISAVYGAATRNATLSIRNLTLSLSPATVGGGNASTATFRLSAAITVPTTATLSTSNVAVASVPASVTIPAGATTAAFPVSTSAVTGTTPVTVRATHAGIPASANLSVRVISPSATSLSPTSVVGGAPSTGTVTLNYAAPSGGYVVTLASSRTAVATVPASVTVPAGSTSTTFPVTSYPVAANTSSSISASGGGVTRSATLTVTAPAVSGLTLNPTTLTSGTTSVGTVTLNGAAPSAGRTVTLTSSNTAAATVPASVVVPAGATSATFTVTARTVTASTAVTISAAAGGATATAALTVNP